MPEIERRIDEIEKRQVNLLGLSGQNGRVGVLEKSLMDHETRIRRLEVLSWKLMGMGAVGAILGGALSKLLL